MAVKYKIDMLIIHLENIGLDGGVELHLDRKQAALLKYAFGSQTKFSFNLYQAVKTVFLKSEQKGVTIVGNNCSVNLM